MCINDVMCRGSTYIQLRIRVRIRIRITLFYIEFLKLQTLAVSYLSMKSVFNKAITKQVNQARCDMFNFAHQAINLYLPVDIECKLFDQLVTPIPLYGSKVWDETRSN